MNEDPDDGVVENPLVEPTSLDAFPDDDDPMARLLRQTLVHEAERVQPRADGLTRIRQRLAEDRRPVPVPAPRRWSPAVALLAAAGVVGVVALGGLLDGRLSGVPRPDPTGQAPAASLTSATVPATSPLISPSAETSGAPRTSVTDPTSPASPTSAPGDGQAPHSGAPGLPVYYVAEQGVTFALFREYHATTLAEPAPRVQEAVTQALGRQAADPDYRSVWPGGSTATTRLADDLITIDLSARAASAALGSQLAELAVQQLVWTATAAANPDGRGPNRQVRILVDGEPRELFGAVDATVPFTRAGGQADPRGQVQISSLLEGGVIGSGIARISGEAVNAAENTIAWSLSRGGQVVQEGTISPTADGGGVLETGRRGVWHLELAVELPGVYTFAVEIPDLSGGESGVRWRDDKTFTVS